jgi:hypothetical protein
MNTTGIVSITLLLSFLTLIYWKKREFLWPVIFLLIGLFFFIANIDDVVSNFRSSPVGYSAQMVPSLVFLIIGGLSFWGAWLKTKRQKKKVISRSAVETHEQIIHGYGEYLAKNPIVDEIRDVSCLPFQKKRILESLIFAHKSENDDKRKELIKTAAITLASFQPDVGQEPLSALGFDLRSIDVNTVDLDDLAAQITDDPSKFARSRFQELNEVVTTEAKTILARFY